MKSEAGSTMFADWLILVPFKLFMWGKDVVTESYNT